MLSWGPKNKYGRHVTIFETKQKINGIHVGPPKLFLFTKFERNPVGGVRVTAPSHSAHLGYFRRLPPASDIRLGRNGQFWDICDAARMNTGVNRQAEGRHSAR